MSEEISRISGKKYFVMNDLFLFLLFYKFWKFWA